VHRCTLRGDHDFLVSKRRHSTAKSIRPFSCVHAVLQQPAVESAAKSPKPAGFTRLPAGRARARSSLRQTGRIRMHVMGAFLRTSCSMPLLVTLSLDDQRCALPLSAVERVVRMVEVTRLLDAPAIVAGIVNVEGRVMPVIDLRRRLALPERETALTDHLIVARTAQRPVALIADAVGGVVECSEADVFAADEIVPGLQHIAGVARLDDGMLVIHDLNRLLSVEEDRALHCVMEAG
jgi:purine-binding chemotaxis protein CheW